MHEYSNLQKKTAASETVQTKTASHGNNATCLQDNRPQSSVLQLARTKNPIAKPTSKRKTISGHGKLRRDRRNKMLKYKVPAGKSIMRPAPPGATLGNLSMLLNERKGLSAVDLRKLMKISTTGELWGNISVVKIIKNDNSIPKTPGQISSMNKIISGQKLTGPEKGSLTKLESKSEFEKWAQSHVENETFKTFNPGEEMEDMQFTPFENKLKSSKPHDENEYVGKTTNLSTYVNSNPGTDDFVVNACSWDPESPYTGFQIDQL